MKKITSLLLLMTALFVSTTIKADGPIPAGTQVFLSNELLFIEVVNSSGTTTNVRLEVVVIGKDAYSSSNPNQPTDAQKAAWEAQTELNIPASINQNSGSSKVTIVFTGIAKEAYKGHANLRTLTIKASSANEFTFGNYAFRECPKLESVTIEQRPKLTFNLGTFFGCANLTSIELPSTAPTDGIIFMASVFQNCTKFDACQQDWTGVTRINGNVFTNTATGSSSDEYEQTLVLPSVNYLGNDICRGTKLKYIQFETIGKLDVATTQNPINSPFYSIRKQIEYVDMSASEVTELGNYLFWGLENADFDIPSSIQVYSKHCLENCKKLGTLYLESAKSIGDSAFVGINAAKVYMPATAPTMGKEVFGAMSDAFTLFIICDDKDCDDAIVTSYKAGDTNENLYTPYAEGRLVQKGQRTEPQFTSDLVINNAVQATGVSMSGWSYGRLMREPLCGMENFVMYVNPNSTYYYACDGSNDTIQKFPLSHYVYDGVEYYPDAFGEVIIPLSADKYAKVQPVFSPILLKAVEAQVTFPQVGDKSDGSTLVIKLPDDAQYEVTMATIANKDGSSITTATLEPETEYGLAFQLKPKDLGRYAFPWMAEHRVDVSQISTTFNFTPMAVVAYSADDALTVAATFTTAKQPTGIKQLEVTKTNSKFIRDGQLFIQRGDELFNAQGVRVQ